MAIFFAGVMETARLESIDIIETNILKINETPADVWDDYEEFKSNYVFTNEPAIYFLNFMGLVGFLYLTHYSWSLGRKSEEMTIEEIAIKFNIFLIIILYIVGVIFNYLVNIFVDQLLIILFNEIYSQIYMFQLLINFFTGFIIFSYLVAWLGNQYTHFDSFSRP
jgi:hypothetical protein